ncbi:MAG: type II toxin-antitoxin system VapB family antitoxin [Chloroflexi bacterium]|nr:type II toxin-antitoxin system VapB family antitoxin [Chloroflexota bacterium]
MTKRTTILADEALLVEAQQFAARNGTSFTKLVETALREYLEVHRPPRRMEFIDMGSSSGPSFSVADGWDEEILAAAADPVAGWSPGASVRRDGAGTRS